MINYDDRKILLKLSLEKPHFVSTIPAYYCQTTNQVSDCGDQLSFGIKINDQNQIDQLVFSGQGCLLSYAAAELLLQAIAGQTVNYALAKINNLINFFLQKNHDIVITGCLEPILKLRENNLRKDCVLISAYSIQKLLVQLLKNE